MGVERDTDLKRAQTLSELPRIADMTRSRMICLHLVEADVTGLILAAHQNLSDVTKRLLQTVALTPDFQRWLHRPNDPLVTTTLSQLAILPPAFRLPDCQTYLGTQIRVGSRIEGLLSCYRFTARGFGLDEIALVTALAEQLGMVLETHRLRHFGAGDGGFGRAAATGPRPARLAHPIALQSVSL